MTSSLVLQDLIAESKDGEWGKGEPFDGSVEMIVVRATDFEDVQYGRPELVPVRFIPPAIAARKKLRQNDIIIETAGGGKDRPTGRTQLLRQWFCSRASFPITCASFCRFIRIDQNKAYPVYVYWLLQGMYAAGVMKQFHTQHTGVARFQYTTFATTQKFSLPSQPAQRKIASILSAYDDLIENNTRRIAILEAMAQAIYREWFVEFRFPGHEKVKLVNSPLGKIPEEWKNLPLSQIADVNAQSIKKGNELVEVNYVDIASVSTGKIDEIRLLPFSEAPGRARRIVRHGDIIWSTVRPNRKSYSLILNPLENMIASTGFAVISGKKPPFTYLYHALTTEEFVGYLVNHATGSAYPAVNSGDFEKAIILVPVQGVLAAFHDATNGMFLLKHNLQKKNLCLRNTRDLLLPKLISGQLNVEDLDIAAEEPLLEAEA